MTAVCAQEAADRARMPIAWLPQTNGFRLRYLVAPSWDSDREGFAFAHFVGTGGEVYLDVTSGQAPLLGDAANISQIVIDGRPVRMDITRMPDDTPVGITFAWEVGGRPYTLSAMATGLISELRVDQAQMVALYRQIRYVSPSVTAPDGAT